MRVTITDKLVSRTAVDGSAVSFAVKVYDDSTEPWVLTAPTTLQYRVDNPITGEVITEWTTVTPASSATVIVSGADNTVDGWQYTRLQLTVRANAGLSTVAVASREWFVRDIAGVST